MTHISIVGEGISSLSDIKVRLEERDTFVSVVKNFDDLKGLQTSTLVVSEKMVQSDNEIINIIEALKLKLFLLIINLKSFLSKN